MTTKRQTEEARQEAIERLRGIVAPGDTLYTTLRHVSASGMYRAIGVYSILPYSVAYPRDGIAGAHYATSDIRCRRVAPFWLSYNVAKACGFRFDDKYEAVGVGGAGMDMGFHIVYALSYALWPNGFDCVGEGCPSNDHSNGDRDYSYATKRKPHHHRNGESALKHEWL